MIAVSSPDLNFPETPFRICFLPEKNNVAFISILTLDVFDFGELAELMVAIMVIREEIPYWSRGTRKVNSSGLIARVILFAAETVSENQIVRCNFAVNLFELKLNVNLMVQPFQLMIQLLNAYANTINIGVNNRWLPRSTGKLIYTIFAVNIKSCSKSTCPSLPKKPTNWFHLFNYASGTTLRQNTRPFA